MKLNLRPNSMPLGYYRTITKIQKEHPMLILCGSAALIMTETLPYRDMHDLDFIIHKKDLDKVGKDFDVDRHYPCQNSEDKYDSYIFSVYAYGRTTMVNLLAFDDDVEINVEVGRFYDWDIKYQHLSDIIKWKEKYNRPKDTKDLEAITTKAFEEAVFDKEDN